MDTATFYTKTVNEDNVSLKNFNIVDDRSTLNAEKTITTSKVTRKIDSITGEILSVISRKKIKSTSEKVSFPLKEVSIEEIINARKNNIPSFIFKENGKYYYTVISKNYSFLSSKALSKHICALSGDDCCLHLSAASDEDGGCAKVRDGSIGIERYPWITVGYESFNTDLTSFVVLSCEHYEKCPPRKKMTIASKKAARELFKDFLYE